MTSDQDFTDEIPTVYFDMEGTSLSVDKDIAHEIYDSGYFGQWTSENSLLLEPEEILLLMDRRRIEVCHSATKQKLTASEIVTHFSKIRESFWSRYLVYKDLRNRGYIVRIGTQITAPFRIYARGAKPGEAVSKKVIFPLAEGENLNLDFLDQIVNQTKIDRKILLLSVVDRLGDVTYYQASQLELEPNELEYEYRDELEPTNQLEEEK